MHVKLKGGEYSIISSPVTALSVTPSSYLFYRGDRLIASLAVGVDRYLAYDPNIALREGHGKIIKMFGGADGAGQRQANEMFQRFLP